MTGRGVRLLGILMICTSMLGCGNTAADLAGATHSMAQNPETALAAQIAPDRKQRDRLTQSAVATSEFGKTVRSSVLAHPSVRSQAYRISGARAAVEGAKAAFRPHVSVGLDAGYGSYSNGFSGSRAGPVISVSQMIYDGSAARLTQLSREEGVALAKLDKDIQTTP